jgi:hypothetical protein
MPIRGVHSVTAPFTEEGATRCSARADASRRTGEPPGKPRKAPQAVTPPLCYQQVGRAENKGSTIPMDSHLAVTELSAEGHVPYLSNSRLFNRPRQRRSSPKRRRCVRICRRLSWRVRSLHFPRQLLSCESGLSSAKGSSEPKRPLRRGGEKGARRGVITKLVRLIARYLRTRSGARAGLRGPLDIPTSRQARNALEV